jgi:peptidoglycan/xylan/chitin deacetylase (PgdA/CDA1 family)
MNPSVGRPRGSALFKHQLRSLADGVASATGILAWLEYRMRSGLTVLMYHRVLPMERVRSSPFPSLVMPDVHFQAQVEWLARRFHVLPIRAALAELVKRRRSARPMVAITFDDGYADNFRIAAPILEQHGVRGSFYVATRFVEGETLWYERAAALIRHATADQLQAWGTEQRLIKNGRSRLGSGKPDWVELLKQETQELRDAMLEALTIKVGAYSATDEDRAMTVPELQMLFARGHEIGSHTLSHPILPLLADDQLSDELKQSREKITSWTGATVPGLAYPNGDYDERVAQAARRVGFAYALTTNPGMFIRGADPMSIPRREITVSRVVAGHGNFDRVAMRSEVSSFREMFR